MTTADITLPEHEAASESRATHLGEKIDTLKEKQMGQPVNVFTTPTGDAGAGHSALPIAAMAMMGHHRTGMDGLGGAGAGLGAGLVGGLLGGLLFGGRGFGNFNNNDGNGFNASAVELGTARVAFDTVALQSLNGIAAAIPAAAASVKDSLLASDAGILAATNAGFAMQNSTALQQTIMLIQQMNANQLTTMQELCNINQNVSAQGCETRGAVVLDGDRTRALLTARFQLEDATEINKLNAKVIELQNEGSRNRQHDELRLQITNTNTAVAAQAQGQQQQQQQQILQGIQSLFPLVQGVLQIAHATNSNVIAGNTAAVTTGVQTASPTNVNAP